MSRLLHYAFFLLPFMAVDLSHAIFIDEELDNLKNDKEVVISTIKKKEVDRIRKKYEGDSTDILLSRLFLENLQEYIDDSYNSCELRLILTFRSKLRENILSDDQESIQEFFKILRVHHHIDDILYETLTGLNNDFFALERLNVRKTPSKSHLSKKKLLENNDLKSLYQDFTEWPDEYRSCSYNNYVILKKNIKTTKGEPSSKGKELKGLNKKAYEAGIISLESYKKLEYLRKDSNINKRNIWLDDYLNIIFKAKNKMRPLSYNYVTTNIEKEDSFSSERIKRFSKITRRKLLYQKYDETQIIMLAQVLQKASRRMGVDPDTYATAPIISQEFMVLMPNGSRETYVEKIELDPQSQYNLARRLLRKDVLELQMMDTFNKLKITHEDVVMAALETGYISLEDIEFAVKYDDLWNPNKSAVEKVVGFIFNVAGYTTFLLPPPWNIAASIAMGIAEGIVDNNFFKTGAENDNPATFIE